MRYQHTNTNHQATSHNRSSGFSSAAEIAEGMGLQLSPRQRDAPALSTIVDHGGHLVLVRRGERAPVWSKWQKRKPALDLVAAHNGRVGLIPHSIGATALDVDFGDPSNLPKPWVGCRSRRPGGVHLYYGDDQARGNQNWQAAGCSGEVRSAKGYLILHPGGAKKIALALDSGVQLNLFPFPAELLQSHEAELIVPDPVKLHAVEPHAKVSLRLEGVYEGARNDSLFEVGRQWAYRQRRGNDLGAWIALVRDFFFFNNKRFPDPMHVAEVRASALQRIDLGMVRVQRDHTEQGQAAAGSFQHRAIMAWHLVRCVQAAGDGAAGQGDHPGRPGRAITAGRGARVWSDREHHPLDRR